MNFFRSVVTFDRRRPELSNVLSYFRLWPVPRHPWIIRTPPGISSVRAASSNMATPQHRARTALYRDSPTSGCPLPDAP